MGNIPNKIESKESLDYHVNTIAGKYILQQNFQDLINLKDEVIFVRVYVFLALTQ